MPYEDVDFQDIPKALVGAGAGYRTIDRNDYVKVMRGMGSSHYRIDDNDIPGVIVRAGAELPSDTTPPVPVSFSPPDNAVGVSLSPLLIVQFDSFVRLGTAGSITLKKTTGNTTIEAWNVATEAGSGAGQVNVFQGTQLTMRLSAPLTAATQYYIVWDAGVVSDLAGNNCATQESTTFWSFTTA